MTYLKRSKTYSGLMFFFWLVGGLVVTRSILDSEKVIDREKIFSLKLQLSEEFYVFII